MFHCSFTQVQHLPVSLFSPFLSRGGLAADAVLVGVERERVLGQSGQSPAGGRRDWTHVQNGVGHSQAVNPLPQGGIPHENLLEGLVAGHGPAVAGVLGVEADAGA